MRLDHFLKQLKSIEPDAAWSARTRASLLGAFPPRPAAGEVRPYGRRTLADILRETLQSGSALALASLALVLILGGLSFGTGSRPVVGTPLDPAAIKAEAQAIDIEVQLSGLEYAYEDVRREERKETTISGRPKVEFKDVNPVLGEVANPAPSPTSTAEEAPKIGIEAALDFLAE